ncbi:MAG: 30S ribosomal protein S16 [bacterium]|nr:30S ribosomal protein S16 [bacterium]
MLTIRLQRVGKTKFPTYRLIISEKARDTQYDCLENLGSFNPHAKDNQLIVKADRVKYWVSKGAQMSGTVNNLLVREGVITGTKKKSVFLSGRRKTKLAEKKKTVAPVAVAAPVAPVETAPVAPVEVAPVTPAEPAPAEASVAPAQA